MRRDTNLFLQYVGPSVIGMLIGGSFSIVDTIFIGQAAGKIGLAAVALTWPVVMLLMAVGELIAAGGAVLIAQEKGAGNQQNAQKLFSGTTLLLLIAFVLLSIIMFPLLSPVLLLLGATPELLPVSLQYCRIITAGLIFSLELSLVLEVVRNDGHPGLSMWIMVAGLLGNIALDWLLIMYFGMGVAGAAVATVISQGVSGIAGLYYFFSSKTALRFRFREIFQMDWPLLKEIFITGLPIFGNMLSVIAMIYMHNSQSLQYGAVDGLASYTVVSALESLGSMLMTGIAAGIQPLSASMYGAGKYKRQNRFGNYGYMLAFITGILLMCFSFAMHTVVPSWMGLSGSTAAVASHAIMLSAPAFLFLGIIRVAGFYYQATGKIGISSWLIYGDSFLALPLSLYTLPLFWGLDGVWLAMPASRVLLMVMLCYFWFGYRRKICHNACGA